MAAAGTGIFFDGATSVRRSVLVELSPEGLVVRDPQEHAMLARWPYDELDHLAAPHGLLRLGRARAPRTARLEVRDPILIAAIDDASVPVDRSGATERRSRIKVIVWSLIATVSLLAAGIVGVPVLADRIAPLIPLQAERWLGEAVDTQARKMLDKGDASRPFECDNEEGRAALARLIGKLETAAALPIPFETKVVRRSEPNAIALPGGHIYVFEGLVDKSETPDELAGVIAHEIGHVAHRDGTRSILQSAGLSFLFGMLLGDFVGGGAVVIGARAVLQSSYSREVEGAADRYGVELMSRAGGDPRALGAILNRIAGTTHPGVEILRDHPDTKARVAVINSVPSPAQPARPLLDGDEWRALKRICTAR